MIKLKIDYSVQSLSKSRIFKAAVIRLLASVVSCLQILPNLYCLTCCTVINPDSMSLLLTITKTYFYFCSFFFFIMCSEWWAHFIKNSKRPILEKSPEIQVHHPPSISLVMYYRTSVTIGWREAGEGPIHPCVRHTPRAGKVHLWTLKWW